MFFLPSLEADTVTVPEGGVNLIAFPIKFIKTWLILSGSAQTKIELSVTIESSVMAFSAATGRKVSITSYTKLPRETRLGFTAELPDSILERSKTSLIKPVRCRVLESHG